MRDDLIWQVIHAVTMLVELTFLWSEAHDLSLVVFLRIIYLIVLREKRAL